MLCLFLFFLLSSINPLVFLVRIGEHAFRRGEGEPRLIESDLKFRANWISKDSEDVYLLLDFFSLAFKSMQLKLSRLDTLHPSSFHSILLKLPCLDKLFPLAFHSMLLLLKLPCLDKPFPIPFNAVLPWIARFDACQLALLWLSSLSVSRIWRPGLFWRVYFSILLRLPDDDWSTLSIQFVMLGLDCLCELLERGSLYCCVGSRRELLERGSLYCCVGSRRELPELYCPYDCWDSVPMETRLCSLLQRLMLRKLLSYEKVIFQSK